MIYSRKEGHPTIFVYSLHGSTPWETFNKYIHDQGKKKTNKTKSNISNEEKEGLNEWIQKQMNNTVTDSEAVSIGSAILLLSRGWSSGVSTLSLDAFFCFFVVDFRDDTGHNNRPWPDVNGFSTWEERSGIKDEDVDSSLKGDIFRSASFSLFENKKEKKHTWNIEEIKNKERCWNIPFTKMTLTRKRTV